MDRTPWTQVCLREKLTRWGSLVLKIDRQLAPSRCNEVQHVRPFDDFILVRATFIHLCDVV